MHKITLGPYKNIHLPPLPMFTEDDLNLGVSEALKKLDARWAKEHKPAEYGDEVVVSLRPEYQNMFVPELAKSNYKFTLGDPSVWEQFKQIAGHKAGEELVLTVPFPPGFSVERVAGKTVTFYVTLQEVIHRHPVELSDEIARQINPEVSGLEELKDRLRRFVAENWLQAMVEARTEMILKEIASKSEYKLEPEEFLKVLKNIAESKQKSLFTSQDPQMLEILLSGNDQFIYEKSKSLAEKTLVENLILTEIARLENIAVEAQELRQAKDSLLEFAGDEQSYFRLFPTEESLLQYVFREKVLDCLWKWNPGQD